MSVFDVQHKTCVLMSQGETLNWPQQSSGKLLHLTVFCTSDPAKRHWQNQFSKIDIKPMGHFEMKSLLSGFYSGVFYMLGLDKTCFERASSSNGRFKCIKLAANGHNIILQNKLMECLNDMKVVPCHQAKRFSPITCRNERNVWMMWLLPCIFKPNDFSHITCRNEGTVRMMWILPCTFKPNNCHVSRAEMNGMCEWCRCCPASLSQMTFMYHEQNWTECVNDVAVALHL